MKYLREYNENNQELLLNTVISIVENNLSVFHDKFKWIYDYYSENEVGYYINLNNITLIDEVGNERDFSYTITDTNLVNIGIKNILTKNASEKFMWYNMGENGGILKNTDMSIKIGSNSKIKPIRYDTNNENYEDILNQLNNQIGFVNKLAELKNDKKIQELYYNSPSFSFNYTMKYNPKNLNNIFKKLNK